MTIFVSYSITYICRNNVGREVIFLFGVNQLILIRKAVSVIFILSDIS